MAWQLNPQLTFEQAGPEWIVFDPNARVVLRASGPAARVLTVIAASPATATEVTDADPLPAHLDDTVAALVAQGVLVEHSTPTEHSTPGMSRRRLISTGALAAGAATLAAAVGIHTLVLPTAAAAASTLAAPTGVVATAISFDQVNVNWTLVTGAVSYQVHFKAASEELYNTFGRPEFGGPVTVTGLQAFTAYNFYVTATDGSLVSNPSEVANATTFFDPS